MEDNTLVGQIVDMKRRLVACEKQLEAARGGWVINPTVKNYADDHLTTAAEIGRQVREAVEGCGGPSADDPYFIKFGLPTRKMVEAGESVYQDLSDQCSSEYVVREVWRAMESAREATLGPDSASAEPQATDNPLWYIEKSVLRIINHDVHCLEARKAIAEACAAIAKANTLSQLACEYADIVRGETVGGI